MKIGVISVSDFVPSWFRDYLMNKVYSEYFKENLPARSTVEVSRLPKNVKIEIKAIACV
ncbi:hypothetical protein KAW65_05950 [candidate division WOR-3 bacterium]|nr:hypothetical protein [candidate division WOR-3 bacterium]